MRPVPIWGYLLLALLLGAAFALGLVAAAHADTHFEVGAGMLVMVPEDHSLGAQALRAIDAGIRYRPDVKDGDTVRPSRLSFTSKYFQTEMTAIGVDWHAFEWEGVEFRVGARGLLRGTYEKMTLGGEAIFGGDFWMGDQQGMFTIGAGRIPDDQRPWVIELGLGVRTD